MRVFLSNVCQFMQKKFGTTNQIKEEDLNYTSQVFLGFIQLKGLENGYKFQIKKNNQPEKKISLGELLIIQADGEIPELLSKISRMNKNTLVMKRKLVLIKCI